MVGFRILIFYTDTFRISAAVDGTIMLIARFRDMLSDPLMGIIADRTSARWGKFRPYLLWTMLADTADYSEWKFGRHATGLVFSAATFAKKAGWGIGGALAGWMLALFQFVPNADQSATTLTGIKLRISVFPGILYMSCAILLWFYAIDHKTCLLMQEELEKRREESEIN
jgi:Na+/melibiose symporter-like transporter